MMSHTVQRTIRRSSTGGPRSDKLAGMKIPVYGVQCLGRKHATSSTKSWRTSRVDLHVSLDQFAFITDLVMAVCYQQSSPEQLQSYEQEVIKEGLMNRGLNKMFDQMMKRKPSATFTPADLRAVPPGRFQILDVDRDCSIRDFVTDKVRCVGVLRVDGSLLRGKGVESGSQQSLRSHLWTRNDW